MTPASRYVLFVSIARSIRFARLTGWIEAPSLPAGASRKRSRNDSTRERMPIAADPSTRGTNGRQRGTNAPIGRQWTSWLYFVTLIGDREETTPHHWLRPLPSHFAN